MVDVEDESPHHDVCGDEGTCFDDSDVLTQGGHLVGGGEELPSSGVAATRLDDQIPQLGVRGAGHGAVGVRDDADPVDSQKVHGEHQGPEGIGGHAGTGIPDDLGVTGDESQHGQRGDAGIDAGEHGQTPRRGAGQSGIVELGAVAGIGGDQVLEHLRILVVRRSLRSPIGVVARFTAVLPINLHHTAIAVRDLEATLRSLAQFFGIEPLSRETVEAQGVEEAMIPLGGSFLQVLAPLQADTPVGRFLDKRGEGLHHLAIQVADIDAALEHLRAQGAELVDDTARVGGGGNRIAFVHPRTLGGVLIELVEVH